jgi:ferredoxin
MKIEGKRLVICNCERSMPLDRGKLEKALAAAGAVGELEVETQLCRAQIENFQRAISKGEPVLVACTQEAPLFEELRAESQPEADVGYFNIRELAGWSEDAEKATPKIAALAAAATIEAQPSPTVSMTSQGTCLVYGGGQMALDTARQLAGRLDVTLLLREGADTLPPAVMDVPVFKGRIREARGHLGGFGITVDEYAPAVPSSRGGFVFEAERDGAFSECDLILDLTGGTPLFPAHEKRDGYLRPDPGDPAAVQKAAFDAAELVGEFEKPRYVRYERDICAHSRSRKTGCTRCLDNCPTGAIRSLGDYVEIDPFVCAGCGNCASVCPTGAATYQYPGVDGLFQRLRALLTSYHQAGGRAPVLLIHDERHGAQMISLISRLGRGLPANVLPFAVNEVTQTGVDMLSAALAYGASQVAILVGPDKRDDMSGIAQNIGLAETVMDGLGFGGGRVFVLDQQDPEAFESALYSLDSKKPAKPGSFLPMGGKRSRTMLSLRHLRDVAPTPVDILPLPQGAPFGRVKVETSGCTMCLACVSVCPTGALTDDPDRPWLGFNEDACVQCGLCRNTCPESVISLEPRLNFTDEARGTIEINREEPFHCVRCGKPFGVGRSIERIVEQLAGKHSMFQRADAAERIMMCEDCRVVVQFETADTPMAAAPRKAVRTTEDDLREREIEEARAKLLRERGNGGGGKA